VKTGVFFDLLFFLFFTTVPDEENLIVKEETTDDQGSPSDVLKKEFGVTHDHGGSLFYIKAMSTGNIAEQQSEAFGADAIVVSLKWKLTQGGVCTVNTKSVEGVDKKCPIEGGATSWQSSLDLSGCVLVSETNGNIAMGACNDDFGKGSHCHVSHSATPEDHPQDAMSQEGKSGMVTESKVNDFLAEKFLAHIVLKKGAHYKINVRCTLASDPAQITEETVEVDPTPTTEECTSSTLKLLGTCKKLTFSSAANAPDKPRLQRVGNNNKNKKRPQPISPMEQAKSNELQAKMDTGAENKEAHADANTMENEDRDKCPVSHLDGVEEMSDEDANNKLEELQLTSDEMDVLKENGHGNAWNHCTPPQKVAMAIKFRKTVESMG